MGEEVEWLQCLFYFSPLLFSPPPNDYLLHLQGKLLTRLSIYRFLLDQRLSWIQ